MRLSSELSTQGRDRGTFYLYLVDQKLRWQPEMTVGVRTKWTVGLVSELENWPGTIPYLVSEKKTSHFWKRKTMRDTELSICIASQMYCFLEEKKNNLPEEPVQDERSRESFREETHAPDVSIKCYPTPLHASFSSQMKEMSQHCTQISARERHWWWTSVSFLLIRIFILKKTLY